MIYIFTDGAATIKGNVRYSASAIYVKAPMFDYVKTQFFPNGTNSIGELFAMRDAIIFADKLAEFYPNDVINIITDSEYVLKSVTKWIYSWAKSGWKKHDGSPVKYSDVFDELYEGYLRKDIKRKNIKYYHITSHIKDYNKARRQFCYKNNVDCDKEDFIFLADNNEIVDALAVNCKETTDNTEYWTIKSHIKKAGL